MTTKRKKIPDEIEAEVIYRSDRECCVCPKRGDHIHHIDGNSSNNKFENLAFLCFDCHNEATLTGGLRKKLGSRTIIKYRDLKYKTIEAKRSNSLKLFNSPINGLTTEDLLTTTKNAVIIIELEKIKEEYFKATWEERIDILAKLNRFSNHSNFRIAVDIISFLSIAADQTRGGMTSEIAGLIFSYILDFFPYSADSNQNKKIVELGNACANIAFSLCYDATIYLGNYKITMFGLTILKFIYKKGKENKLQILIDKVNSVYDELEETLQRPERNDLADALELVRWFRKDIKEGTLVFPALTSHLMKVVYPERY